MRWLCVAGPRDFTGDPEIVARGIERVISSKNMWKDPDLGILHGGAVGVDTLARDWAIKHGVAEQAVKPDYDLWVNEKYAPIARNKQMAQMCEWLLAFWGGRVNKSGTHNMITEAVHAGKPVQIVSLCKERWLL